MLPGRKQNKAEETFHIEGEGRSTTKTAVHAWLSEKGLAELAPVFVAKDYCDVDLMNKIGLDNDDLDFLEIHDSSKRAILLGKQAAAPSPAPARA